MPGRAGLFSSQRQFKPDCGLRILQASSKLLVPSLGNAKTDEAFRLYLADMEDWVRNCLNDWLTLNIHSPNSPVAPAEIVEDYVAAASRAYEGALEDFFQYWCLPRWIYGWLLTNVQSITMSFCGITTTGSRHHCSIHCCSRRYVRWCNLIILSNISGKGR
jgi:hypothetical protein